MAFSRRRWSVRCAAALIALCAAQSAAAQERSLERAFTAYQAGELDVALERFEQALRAPGNEPHDLAAIHLHLGVLRGAVGDLTATEQCFAFALAIEPDLEPPPELGGDLRERFTEIRDVRGGQSVTLNLQTPAGLTTGTEAAIRLSAEHAPEGLIQALRLSLPDGGWSRTVEGTAPVEVSIPTEAWPPEGATRLVAEALDEHGGVVARTSIEVPAAAIDQATEETGDDTSPEVERERRRPWYRSPWLWIGVGALVVGGAVTGVVLGTAEDRYVIGAPQVR